LGIAFGEVTDDEVRILTTWDFSEASSRKRPGNGFVDSVAKQVGIHLHHGEMFDAANVGEGFILTEIEIGIEINIGLGEGGSGNERAAEDEGTKEEVEADLLGHETSGGWRHDTAFGGPLGIVHRLPRVRPTSKKIR
jgi:hypothetical protein